MYDTKRFHKMKFILGDPFVRCNDNPCSQDPCGQNADCEAQGARAVCRCR